MKYRTTAILSLPAGSVLELTKEQAAARAHLLDKRGNKYVARETVMFKSGEVLGIANPGKVLLGRLAPAEGNTQIEAGA